MTSLRERQKEDRGRRIVGSARVLFKQRGYEHTTIEAIADAAGVSGVTVHNYYGTKAGVLLALVVESDDVLIERLGHELPEVPGGIEDAARVFFRIMLEHAMSHLEKPLWRQVLAAVMMGTSSQLAQDYAKLDLALAQLLAERARAKQADGTLTRAVDAEHLGHALFQLMNARFIGFVQDDDSTMESVERAFQQDLAALSAVRPGSDA